MNSRVRVNKVLTGQVPDSVPRALYDVAIDRYNDTTLELFQRKTGKHPRDCFRQDLRGLAMASRDNPDAPRDALREIGSAGDVHRALDDWVPSRADFEGLRRAVDAWHRQGYPVIAVGTVSDFETPFEMRGREQFFLEPSPFRFQPLSFGGELRGLLVQLGAALGELDLTSGELFQAASQRFFLATLFLIPCRADSLKISLLRSCPGRFLLSALAKGRDD